jgi:hypothetical protein
MIKDNYKKLFSLCFIRTILVFYLSLLQLEVQEQCDPAIIYHYHALIPMLQMILIIFTSNEINKNTHSSKKNKDMFFKNLHLLKE